MSPILPAGAAAPPAPLPAPPAPQAGIRPFEMPEVEGGRQLPPILLNRDDGQPSTWGHLVQSAVRDVAARQAAAGELVRDVLAGGATPPHQAIIALEEASVSFQMLAEMRNKLVESYQEIMRMQV